MASAGSCNQEALPGLLNSDSYRNQMMKSSCSWLLSTNPFECLHRCRAFGQLSFVVDWHLETCLLYVTAPVAVVLP